MLLQFLSLEELRGELRISLTKPTLQVSQEYSFIHPPPETNLAALTSAAYLTRHLLQGC